MYKKNSISSLGTLKLLKGKTEREKNKYKENKQHPTRFKPTIFQFSDWQATALTT